MAIQLHTEVVAYKTAAGNIVPAILTAAYDTNGALTTDKSDTVTADLIVVAYSNTKLTRVTRQAAAAVGVEPDAGKWNWVTAFQA